MRTSTRQEQFLLAVTCFLICAHLAQTQLYLQPFLDLDAFANFHAEAPYQYRILTAWMFRVFNRLLAPTLATSVASLHEPFNNPIIFFEFFLALASLIIASTLTYKTATKIGLNARYAWFAIFALLYMTYFNLSVVRAQQFYLPYDLTALAFFCACLYLAVEARLIAFVIVFVFAVLNRETAILYIVPLLVLGLTTSHLRRHRILATAFSCALIWAALKIAIHHLLPDITGKMFVVRIGYNLHALVMPQRLLLLLSVMGFLWIPISLYSWRSGPHWLRVAAAIYPIWFGAMFIVGVVIEIRIFVELAAIAALHVTFIFRDRALMAFTR